MAHIVDELVLIFLCIRKYAHHSFVEAYATGAESIEFCGDRPTEVDCCLVLHPDMLQVHVGKVRLESYCIYIVGTGGAPAGPAAGGIFAVPAAGVAPRSAPGAGTSMPAANSSPV